MTKHNVKIKSIVNVTHNVLRIVTEKPDHFKFIPGQATEISINKPDWIKEKRPFTFTCLPDNKYLEFTIKTYPERKGVTNQLLKLNAGDELILHDVFGAICYNGEGLFIAGGTGVTPFICILRYLQANDKLGRNKLLFANKTRSDIINEEEFKSMLKGNFINILSDELAEGCLNGYITIDLITLLSAGMNKMFYLCGPPPMMDAVERQLDDLHVNEKLIIKEAI